MTRIRTWYHVAEADGAQAHEAEITRVYRYERSALLTLPPHYILYIASYLCTFYVKVYIYVASTSQNLCQQECRENTTALISLKNCAVSEKNVNIENYIEVRVENRHNTLTYVCL